ncbi:DUF397 domain-containing protein [Streptomyces sp. HUCO-GS316]|nr:DUF397 domain-containing protein [Streptomyces sp. HUCO-GS316]
MAELSGSNRLAWFTSSYSNGAGGECVECALADDGALIRDSKDAYGPVVRVGSQTWLSFIRSVKGKESAGRGTTKRNACAQVVSRGRPFPHR